MHKNQYIILFSIFLNDIIIYIILRNKVFSNAYFQCILFNYINNNNINVEFDIIDIC